MNNASQPLQTTSIEIIENVFQSQLNLAVKIGDSSVKERIQKLKRLEIAVLESQDELINAIHSDFAKPEFETLLSEIATITSEIRHVIHHLKSWMRPKRLKRFITIPTLSGEIEYRSKGVCLILSPWNYPFNLAISPLISAIAAGNCVIIKPSELTPHTSYFIEKLVSRVFHSSEVAVVQGDAEVAQYLTSLPFNHIFFTGSPMVGKKVMEAASKNLSSVTLELGGKSPVIVTKSADINLAAKRIIFGKYINGGQTCIAPDYVLVNETKKDELLNKLKENMLSFKIGHELEGSNFCKIITRKHAQRLKDIIEDAIEKGASLICGGHVDVEKREVEFTLLSDITDSMLVMQEELFGPILPVKSYDELFTAVNQVLSLPRPLASYIFTSSENDIQVYSSIIRTGSVVINDVIVQYGHPNAPFGGVNNSGIGNAHGYYGFKAFSHEQPIIRSTKWSPIDLFHPPYKDLHKKIIKAVIKWF
ncbi:MAG: aldehyde dehydrogenase family protein [Bacteroidetes bacterium]|nr:aldehyde dehydrogenase family protein [Bacteroidota bacterium]